ncbi:MAG TPA: hypothetical protein VNO30_43845 [Kofleriaceae bacterium]|nr:hypothetical protein [Kofleriaceae bacterium]
MRTVRENIEWDALRGSVIIGAEVERCGKCGALDGVTFQSLSQLIDVAARTVVAKQGRLSGAEVRFLRSFLDLEGAELAETLGSNPSTVSRWENDRQPIGRHADLFLRALVLLELGETTSASYFRQIAKDIVEPQPLAFEYRDGVWAATSVPKRRAAAQKRRAKTA